MGGWITSFVFVVVNEKLLTTYSGELCQLLLIPIVIVLISSTLLFFKQFFVFILGKESGSVNRFGYPVYCCCQQLKFFCRFGRKKSIIASLILAAIGAFASVLIESEGGGSKGENNQYPNTVCYFPAGRSAWWKTVTEVFHEVHGIENYSMDGEQTVRTD